MDGAREGKAFEASLSRHSGRRPCEPSSLTVRQAEPLQVALRDFPQGRRDAAGQLVADETQCFQAGKLSQLRGYWPTQLIIGQVQNFQVGELPQFGRHCTCQPVG